MTKETKKNWRLNPYSNGLLFEQISRVKITPSLCLNPYSNGLLSEMWKLVLMIHTMVSLNPYSNGLLSESLTESVLRFPHFFILQKSLLFLRELVQLEWFFRKCMRLKVSFQIKMEQFSLSSLRNRQIHLRKSDAYLNNIRHLRNSYFK